MSQTFQITWVGDRTRDWETDKGQFTEYKIALAGYDPSENDPEAGKTVAWSRRRDAQAPAPGDEVFGHIEIKTYDWGNKYVFKTDQAEQGRPPSFKKATNGGPTPRVTEPVIQDSDWWYAKDRRISRAGVLQAVVASGLIEGVDVDTYVATVNEYTDALLASLDERTPHPRAPTAAPQQAVGASNDRAESKPVIEDVTPKRASAPISDDSEVPF
jgi:hypothetical protein